MINRIDFKNGTSIGFLFEKEYLWPKIKVERYFYDGLHKSISIEFLRMCFWFDKFSW